MTPALAFTETRWTASSRTCPATICRGAARNRLSSLRFLVLNQLPGHPSRAIFAATSYPEFVSTARGDAPSFLEGRNMANNNDDDDVPFMQKLLDNHFLLLFLGVASPTVLYILWGVVDIMSVPLAK
jgi:hypothetical protein